jgi:hypothetical protein
MMDAVGRDGIALSLACGGMLRWTNDRLGPAPKSHTLRVRS